MVLLARELGPAAFGAFTLAYTALLFANSLQSALITQPHNVLGATRLAEDYDRYTASTAITQVLLALVSASVVIGAAATASVRDWQAASLLFALGPAIFFWQMQEFVRRVLYTEERLGAAFLNDVVSYGGQALVIAVLWRLHVLSGPSTLYALAASSFAAMLVGCWQLKPILISPSFDLDVVRANWQFGKWLAGGQLGYWFSSQLYLYLSAILLGATATGAIRASQVLLGPLTVLLAFLESVLPIRFSRILASGGERALNTELKRSYILTAPAVAGYVLVVAVFGGPLMRVVYGDVYAGYSTVLALFGIYYLASYVARVVSAALRAKAATQPIFKGYLYSSAFALTGGWLLVRFGGVEGAILGMIASLVVMNIVIWRAYVITDQHQGAYVAAENGR
jgi:O-antigen/teichoic acid export membrane protein